MAKLGAGRKISEGIHKVKIVECKDQDPKPGKEYGSVIVTYQVIDEGPEKGVEFSEWLSLVPTAKFKWNMLFDAIGIDDDWAKTVDTERDLPGKKLRVNVAYEDYQGRVSAKATEYLPLEGAVTETVTPGFGAPAADGKGKSKKAPERPSPFA